MLRALIHIGLSALLIIAPALCCCNVRLLAGLLAASPGQPPACPSCAEPAPPATPSCCHAEKTLAKPVRKASCCRVAEPAAELAPSGTNDTKPAPSKPAAPKPDHCDFCDGRPDATPPETAPSAANPEPTGELIPLALLGLADVPPEHLGLLGGLEPPERAGVDTRSATLFSRHVLRC